MDRYVEIIDSYLEKFSKKMNKPVLSLKLRLNRKKNFYVPYRYIEEAARLKEIQEYAEYFGYRMVFDYALDKKYYENLLIFKEFLICKKAIGPIDIEFLNSINIIKVGLDINGAKELDIFKDKRKNIQDKGSE